MHDRPDHDPRRSYAIAGPACTPRREEEWTSPVLELGRDLTVLLCQLLADHVSNWGPGQRDCVARGEVLGMLAYLNHHLAQEEQVELPAPTPGRPIRRAG